MKVLVKNIILQNWSIMKFTLVLNKQYPEKKKLKGGSRQKKIDLIDKFNPEWKDLWDSIIG